MKIPIVIGVTGHRNLREADLPKLRETAANELTRLTAAYPHSEFVMLNSIASGADSLCAQIALELGMRLVCPLPMEAREYRKDFSGEDAELFDRLLQSAEDVFVAPDVEPVQDTRDFHYRQAGIYVAAHSHVLLALWDGGAPKPGGCGTAETVGFMLDGVNGDSLLRSANDGAVLHILAPREGSDADQCALVRLIENELGALSAVLRATDEFNAEAVEAESDSAGLLPEDLFRGRDLVLDRLNSLYRSADALSMRFQEKYLRAMRLFSLFGVLLVLSFLLYDELETPLFLPIYGALIIVYILAYLLVRREKSHEKYLQYRVFSEALRVQFYLRASGARDSVADSFTWTQKQESTWIREAIPALLAGETPQTEIPMNEIRKAWIDGQAEYHRMAYMRDFGKHVLNEKTTRGLTIASVVLFVVTFVLEFFFGELMAIPVFAACPVFTLRGLMKIVLGVIPAATAFLANYYGKLSFERKSIDHAKMTAFYAQAGAQLESRQTEPVQLFRELAREEIIECGNWYSYCRENPPGFNL